MKQYIKREFNEAGNMISEEYFNNARMTKLHRTDGPAGWYLTEDGDIVEEWYVNGELHNEKGYASTITDRHDGKLVVCCCEYYIKGEIMSEIQWKKAVAALEAKRNPKPSAPVCKLDGKIVLIDGLEYTLQLVVK